MHQCEDQVPNEQILHQTKNARAKPEGVLNIWWPKATIHLMNRQAQPQKQGLIICMRFGFALCARGAHKVSQCQGICAYIPSGHESLHTLHMPISLAMFGSSDGSRTLYESMAPTTRERYA